MQFSRGTRGIRPNQISRGFLEKGDINVKNKPNPHLVPDHRNFCLTARSWMLGPAGTNGSSTYRWSLLVGAEESKEESIGRFVFFAKPNPAKGQTVLNFQLTRQTAVELSIYDIQGRLVKNLINDIKQAGTHKISWDGFDGKDNRVSAGIYFCKLKTENTDYLEKLILVK